MMAGGGEARSSLRRPVKFSASEASEIRHFSHIKHGIRGRTFISLSASNQNISCGVEDSRSPSPPLACFYALLPHFCTGRSPFLSVFILQH